MAEKMRKLFLYGRSEVGKTTLTQALKGAKTEYEKTQYVKSWDITIDTPGEYTETKELTMEALACFSYESDLEAYVCGADEPFNLMCPGIPACINRPLIGVITKINSPKANVAMVRQWQKDAGCNPIFLVDSITGEGIVALREFLFRPKPSVMKLEEAIRRQNAGIPEF